MLDRQIIDVPLAGGVDTKTDPKQIPIGKLSRLINGVFTTPKSLRKRNGFTSLTNALPNNIGTAVATFKDELVAFDGRSLYSRDDIFNTWITRGSLTHCKVSQKSIYGETSAGGTNPVGFADSAIHSTLKHRIYVWHDIGSSSCKYLIENPNGTVIVPATTYSSGTASKPKVLAIGATFCAFHADSLGQLWMVPISASTGIPGAAVMLTNLLDTPQLHYDVAISGTSFVAVYYKVGRIEGGLYSSAGVAGNQIVMIGTATGAISLFLDASGNVMFLWSDKSSLFWAGWNSTLTSQTIATTSTAKVAYDISHISGASNTGLSGDVRIAWSETNGSSWLTRCQKFSNGVAGAVDWTRYQARLCAKVFLNPLTSTDVLVPVNRAWEQPTGFVINTAGKIIAKVLANNAVVATLDSCLPETIAESTYQREFVTRTNDGRPIRRSMLRFDGIYNRSELGNALHVSSGHLVQYDGVNIVEQGFHLYPDIISTVSGGGGSGHTYQYVFVYEWSDKYGQTHYSAPSIPHSVVTTAVISGVAQVTVKCASLQLTNKTGVRVGVYRTIDNGTVFYKLGTVANAATEFTQYVDGATDGSIISQAQLYTTGGVLENIGPPAPGAMASHKSRLFVVEAETPERIWYSKQVLPNLPVEFSDLLTINVDSAGGGVVALASMDDKLVIFKSDRIFVLMGDGPSATGSQSDYADPQLVTTDVGCVEPRSIVRMPNGLMFKSARGIYLIDRGLGVHYVGAEVEQYNSIGITSAVLIPNTTQVRLSLATGNFLVFDYLVNQWAVFFPPAAVDSTIYNGSHHFVTSAGVVKREVANSFSDDGAWIALSLTTPWIKLGGLQGFQRVRRMEILGTAKSLHTLTCSLAYDYNQTIVDSIEMHSQNTSNPMQWRVHLPRQKCEALQVTLEDSQLYEYPVGEALNLSGLSFEVGVKRGMNKLPALKTVG